MTRKIDFSAVKAFIAKGDKAARLFQWKVGDLLIAALGPPHLDDASAGHELMRLSKELEADGHEYAPATLRQLRLMAHAFPETRRHYDLSFGIHADARDPDTLEAIIAQAPPGQGIVQAYVRAQMQAREVAVMRALEEERARREREVVQAKKDLRDVRDAHRRKELEERIRKLKVPPRRHEIERREPDADEMTSLVAKARFDVLIGRIQELVKELEEDHVQFFPHFTETEVECAVNDLLEIANKTRSLSDQARKDRVNKRSHLAVVA